MSTGWKASVGVDRHTQGDCMRERSAWDRALGTAGFPAWAEEEEAERECVSPAGAVTQAPGHVCVGTWWGDLAQGPGTSRQPLSIPGAGWLSCLLGLGGVRSSAPCVAACVLSCLAGRPLLLRAERQRAG